MNGTFTATGAPQSRESLFLSRQRYRAAAHRPEHHCGHPQPPGLDGLSTVGQGVRDGDTLNPPRP